MDLSVSVLVTMNIERSSEEPSPPEDGLSRHILDRDAYFRNHSVPAAGRSGTGVNRGNRGGISSLPPQGNVEGVLPALEQISLRREPAALIDVSRIPGNDAAEDWEGADAGDFGDGGGVSAYGSKRVQYWDNWKSSTSAMGADTIINYASSLELLSRRQIQKAE